MRKINVPIELIRRCSKDKRQLQCLALAIILKRTYTNSTLYDVNTRNFRRVFHISYATALKMIDACKESDLFVYNEKRNCLFAKSFKSTEVKRFGKRGKFLAKADYCKKITECADSLRDVTRLLRETLLALVVEAKQRESLFGHAKKTDCDGTNAKAPIPLRKFAKSINMSKSSAGRYINRMAKDGKVSKSDIVAECVLPYYTVEKAAEWMKAHPGQVLQVWYSEKHHQYTAWITYGRKYSVTDGELSNSYQHVIYNHRKRIHTINKKKNADEDSRPDFFYGGHK